jgi:hypothetical protein
MAAIREGHDGGELLIYTLSYMESTSRRIAGSLIERSAIQ